MPDIITLPFKYLVGANNAQYNDDILYVSDDKGNALIASEDWSIPSKYSPRDYVSDIEITTYPVIIVYGALDSIVLTGDLTLKLLVGSLMYVDITTGTVNVADTVTSAFTITASVYDDVNDQTTLTMLEDVVLPGPFITGTLRTYPKESTSNFIIKQKDYVYFYRENILNQWEPITTSDQTVIAFVQQASELGSNSGNTYKREHGRGNLNFLWMHRTPNAHLIDPATTNIHDTFLIPRSYYTSVKEWLDGITTEKPAEPTPQELRASYGYLLANKMLSDTVVLHPGKIKVLFGPYAPDELQVTFKVIRSKNRSLTDNQIKYRIVTAIRTFFYIERWEFGETFYFTELSSYIHNDLPTEIDSIVIVPLFASNKFGDMFQVNARENEVLQPHISVNDVEIVESYNRTNIRQLE